MSVKPERAGVVQNRSTVPIAPASVKESSKRLKGVHHLAEVLEEVNPQATATLEPAAVLVQGTEAPGRRSRVDGGSPRLDEIQIWKGMDFSRLEGKGLGALDSGTVNRPPEGRVGRHIS